jgi:hypothetical protein
MLDYLMQINCEAYAEQIFTNAIVNGNLKTFQWLLEYVSPLNKNHIAGTAWQHRSTHPQIWKWIQENTDFENAL